MTAPQWVDPPISKIVADSPLHAGITVDAWLGDLARAYQEQVYDSCSIPFELDKLTHGFASLDWEHLDEFSAIVVPLRAGLDGSWKTVWVSLEGRCSAVGQSVTVAAYLRSEYAAAPVYSTSGGFSGETPGLFVFSSTSWVWEEKPITPDRWAASLPPINSAAISEVHTYPVAYLVLLAISDDAAGSIYLRGLRIREEASVP